MQGFTARARRRDLPLVRDFLAGRGQNRLHAILDPFSSISEFLGDWLLAKHPKKHESIEEKDSFFPGRLVDFPRGHNYQTGAIIIEFVAV